jgi:hypothetical protein
MAERTISIPVDTKTAQAYSAMSPEKQKKMQVLLNLQIQELLSDPDIPLKELMDDIGTKAQERGLTPEILEELLRDD